MRRLPILVAVLALVALAGCAPAGPKEIQVTVTDMGFQPKEVVVPKGQAAVIVFTRKTDSTCATEAMFAETGKKYDLPLNTPVRVDLTGVSPGTLHYACAMNMEKGTVVIE
jgi:plastocyanin domain-containing protein